MLPQAILDEFLDVPPGTTDENEWYGTWNVLLTTRGLDCKTSGG